MPLGTLFVPHLLARGYSQTGTIRQRITDPDFLYSLSVCFIASIHVWYL